MVNIKIREKTVDLGLTYMVKESTRKEKKKKEGKKKVKKEE